MMKRSILQEDVIILNLNVPKCGASKKKGKSEKTNRKSTIIFKEFNTTF